jgi:hypothetical protein
VTAQADLEHFQFALCPVHSFEQAPQLLSSSVSLTHAVPHLTSGEVHTQTLLMHVAPVGQATPQDPQLLLSSVVSTHVVPLQSVSEPGHVHFSPTQDVPEGHFLPHALQLFESIVTSVQDAPPPASGAPASPPHMMTLSPFVLSHRQAPLMQSAPGGHFLPHVPQLFGSLDALTHVWTPLMLHIVVAPVHAHMPVGSGSHPTPDVHAFPQPPQLVGS